MVRIKCAIAVAAFLMLPSSLSFAAEGNQKPISLPGEIPIIASAQGSAFSQIAASPIQGEANQLARDSTVARPEPLQAKSTPAPITMEYPALALLAMAIISVAALSRRDSLGIDR
jgi:hypothetical protein